MGELAQTAIGIATTRGIESYALQNHFTKCIGGPKVMLGLCAIGSVALLYGSVRLAVRARDYYQEMKSEKKKEKHLQEIREKFGENSHYYKKLKEFYERRKNGGFSSWGPAY